MDINKVHKQLFRIPEFNERVNPNTGREEGFTYNCAEYTVDVLCRYLEIEDSQRVFLRKISSVFGGGQGDREGHCGIYSGFAIVFGFLYGRDDHFQDKQPFYDKMARFKQLIINKFKESPKNYSGKWWEEPDKQFLCRDILDERNSDSCRDFLHYGIKAFLELQEE